MQKPSVGRIVHVIVDPAVNNGTDVAPALITRVWSDEMVNVRVLHDGPAVVPSQQNRQEWVTSVPLAESREALDEGRETPATFGAFWPPRV